MLNTGRTTRTRAVVASNATKTDARNYPTTILLLSLSRADNATDTMGKKRESIHRRLLRL